MSHINICFLHILTHQVKSAKMQFPKGLLLFMVKLLSSSHSSGWGESGGGVCVSLASDWNNWETTAVQHLCEENLSQDNKCEKRTTASYPAPKVGKLPCSGQEASQEDGCTWWERITDGGRNVCSTHSGLQRPRVRLCMCADGRTPNPKCHIQFPAKHLAPAQRNWLVSADVIMVYGLIPVSRSWVPLAHILPCCISTLCGIFWPPWTQMSRICSQWVRALLSAILQKRTHLSKQSSIIIRPTAVMKRSDWK